MKTKYFVKTQVMSNAVRHLLGIGRYLMFIVGVSMLGQVLAATASSQHVHPNTESEKQRDAASLRPGYCQIELFNNSYEDVTVYGEFDDGTILEPFIMYAHEAPHYISLYYYFYCHRDMYLDIVTDYGIHVYSGYTPANSRIVIFPYLKNQLKAEMKAR